MSQRLKDKFGSFQKIERAETAKRGRGKEKVVPRHDLFHNDIQQLRGRRERI